MGSMHGQSMEKIQLARIDLNLLVALRALVRTRHVTRAAELVGITQPAMSRALTRLRRLFNDPLLMRGRHGYELTARAQALLPQLEASLSGIEGILQPSIFTPATASGSLTLCTTDFGSLYYIPYFLEMLHAHAPAIDVRVRNWDQHAISLIEHGEADIGIAIIEQTPPHMRYRRMGSDRLVSVVRAQHPAIGNPSQALDIAAYCAYDHIHVPSHLGPEHNIDQLLAQYQARRRIAVEIPHFIAALHAASQADFIVTLPELFARTIVDTFGLDLEILPLPMPVPSIHYGILWHERGQNDPAQRWIRELMVEGFRQRFKGMVRLFEHVIDVEMADEARG